MIAKVVMSVLCMLALAGLLVLRDQHRAPDPLAVPAMTPPPAQEEPPPHLRRGTLNLTGCRLDGHGNDERGNHYMKLQCDRGVVVLVPSGHPPEHRAPSAPKKRPQLRGSV